MEAQSQVQSLANPPSPAPPAPEAPQSANASDAGDEVAAALAAVENGEASSSGSDDIFEAINIGNKMLEGAKSEPKTDAPAEAKPAPEAKAEEKAPAQDDKLASKFAKLHEKSKELFAREQKLKTIEDENKSLKSTLEAMRDDPASALEAMGFKDIREFVERFAEDGGKLSPERRAIKELQAQLEAQKAERAKEQESKAQAEAQAKHKEAVDNVNKDIVEFLKTNTEKYGLLGPEGSSSLVYQELQSHFDSTKDEDGVGEVLPLDQAVERAHARIESGVKALIASPAGRARLQALLDATKSNPEPAAASSKPATKTIAGARAGTAKPTPNTRKSDDETFEEALQMLKQQTRSR